MPHAGKGILQERLNNNSDISAVILAGGLGTRLRPVVNNFPKCMVPVSGRPFVEFLLDQVIQAGINNITLATGYQAEKIELSSWEARNRIKLQTSRETTPLGTAGALRKAWEIGQSKQLLVLNGDSYCGLEVQNFISWIKKEGFPAGLVTIEVEKSSRYGGLEIDDNQKVLSFQEKIRNRNKSWINAGIYLLPGGWIAEVPREKPVSLEMEMFPNWIKKGLYAFKGQFAFLDIGTPESLAQAERFFQREAKK